MKKRVGKTIMYHLLENLCKLDQLQIEEIMHRHSSESDGLQDIIQQHIENQFYRYDKKNQDLMRDTLEFHMHKYSEDINYAFRQLGIPMHPGKNQDFFMMIWRKLFKTIPARVNMDEYVVDHEFDISSYSDISNNTWRGLPKIK